MHKTNTKRSLFIIGILCGIILISSCNFSTNTTLNSSTSVVGTQNSPLQQFLLDWINDNPQWENNQVTKEETDAKFIFAFIDSMHHHNMLEELTFTLEKVGMHKSKYIVLLKHDTYKSGRLHPQIWCGVIGFVSKENVGSLIEGKDYRFKGKFKSIVYDRSNYFPYSTVLGDTYVGKRGETMHLATSVMDIDSIWCINR